MQSGDFHNVFKEYEPGLTGIGTEPIFAIGQRALLLQTDQGNILWDCITYLDHDTVAAIQQRGGLKAIAISHPHFYTTIYALQERLSMARTALQADLARFSAISSATLRSAGSERKGGVLAT
jgi:hypothetical protein